MVRNEIDLVLINPPNRMQVYQSLARDLAAVENPVWAGLLASFVRKRGYRVMVIDAGAEELTAGETAGRIATLRPALAAVVVYGHQPSASTQIMPGAGAVCRALKEEAPELPVLMVGGHVAALPERTLREEAADFVCGGEGPVTIAELIEALRSNGSEAYRKVRGLWYRSDGNIIANAPAPIVKDVTGDMPGIPWDLFPMEKYRAHNWHCFQEEGFRRVPYAAIYTSLGCPYHCSFCCIQAPFKSGEPLAGYSGGVANSYRMWNPQFVVDQMAILAERYGVRNIKFADEMFVLNRKHVEGICDLLIERGLGEHFNIWAYARVDTVKEEMLEKLSRAGLRWLCFGIESGAERVRDNVEKGFEQHQIFDTVEKVRAAGINVIANFIFGLPEDDLDTMQRTLDLALELNCEFSNFYSAMAYPGSSLYDLAVKEGWPLPEKWSGYSQHSVDTLPLPTRHVEAAEVLRFRDHAFQVYFNNAQYLDMIGRKFGPAIRQHIQGMCSYRLERKYAVASADGQ